MDDSYIFPRFVLIRVVEEFSGDLEELLFFRLAE